MINHIVCALFSATILLVLTCLCLTLYYIPPISYREHTSSRQWPRLPFEGHQDKHCHHESSIQGTQTRFKITPNPGFHYTYTLSRH